MYEAPKLEKFGSFRELTLTPPVPRSKTIVGTDLWVSSGMCTDNPDFPNGPAECRS
jgi:hypothetical protein